MALFDEIFEKGKPSALALVCNEQRWTFAQLKSEAEYIAAVLHDKGIGVGDTVMGLFKDGPQSQIVVLACLRIGATWLPAEWEYSAEQLGYQIQDAGVSALFMFNDIEMEKVLANYVKTIFVIEEEDCFKKLNGNIEKLPVAVDGQLAFVTFTSGSTGRPKAVLISWAAARNTMPSIAKALDFNSNSRILIAGWPNILSAVLMRGLTTLSVGGTVYIAPPTPDCVLNTIEQEKITIWGSGPKQLRGVLDLQSQLSRDLSSLQLVWSGGEAVAPALVEQCNKVFSIPLTEVFGTTEAGMLMYTQPDDPKHEAGAFACLFPGVETRVVDEQDTVVGIDAVGELIVKTGCMMDGYLHHDLETEKALRGGWYHTGDFVRRDSLGRIHFFGRGIDVLMREGLKISVSQIELALESHPCVRLAAVIGVPDGDIGDAAVAFIVPSDGSKPSESELQTYVLEKVGTLFPPKHCVFMPRLPLGSTSKVDRQLLRSQALSMFVNKDVGSFEEA